MLISVKQLLRILVGLLGIAALWAVFGGVLFLITWGRVTDSKTPAVIEGLWLLAVIAAEVGYVWWVIRKSAKESGRVTPELLRVRAGLRNGKLPD